MTPAIRITEMMSRKSGLSTIERNGKIHRHQPRGRCMHALGSTRPAKRGQTNAQYEEDNVRPPVGILQRTSVRSA